MFDEPAFYNGSRNTRICKEQPNDVQPSIECIKVEILGNEQRMYARICQVQTNHIYVSSVERVRKCARKLYIITLLWLSIISAMSG